MKKSIYISFLWICLQTAYAQRETNNWYFGSNAGLNFNTSPPTVLTNGQLDTEEGCATISNSNGRLLFYTDGDRVWDSTHAVMPNGIDLGGCSSTTQSALIVPKPGSSTLFYIFSVAMQTQVGAPPGWPCQTQNGGVQYALLDMTANGGLGDVILKNISLTTPTPEQVTGVLHSNGTDYWVITHKYGNTNNFLAFLVSSSGVSATPVVSSVGSFHKGWQGYIKASPDRKKIAWGSQVGSIFKFELFDFDNSTGKLSNPIDLNLLQNAYGVSFSPDNSKLYVTTNSATPLSWQMPFRIYQYDLSSQDSFTIVNSKFLIDSSAGGFSPAPAALQMGPDKKIYMANKNSLYLGVISCPNSPGLFCNYVKNSIYLSGKVSRFGLPNFMDHESDEPALDFSYSDTCFGDTVKFNTLSANTFNWDFGDPSSVNNTSSIQYPTHVFSNYGTFAVTLNTGNVGCLNTIAKKIKIVPPVFLNLYDDTTICKGASIHISAGNADYDYQWHPTGQTVNAIDVLDSGLYLVKASNVCFSDSQLVHVSLNDCEWYIPSAFSPNNDGLNDVFYIQNQADFTRFSLTILDKWGNEMFHSGNIQNGWNGKYKGEVVQQDVYVYYVRYATTYSDGYFTGRILVVK